NRDCRLARRLDQMPADGILGYSLPEYLEVPYRQCLGLPHRIRQGWLGSGDLHQPTGRLRSPLRDEVRVLKEKKPIAEMSVAELEKAIQHHNELYFKLAKPEISDYEFDRMVERLKKLKPKSAVLEKVGSDLSEGAGKKVEHSSPMLSLDKCYKDEDLF